MPLDPQSTPPPPVDRTLVTLNCPQCAAPLRTAAATRVEGPCPKCGTTIRYEPPGSPAPPATFVPRKPRSDRPDEPEFEKPRSKPEPRPIQPLAKRSRSWIRQAKKFFRTNTGRLVLCAAIGIWVFAVVFLFFKWDRKRHANPANPSPPTAAGQTQTPEASP